MGAAALVVSSTAGASIIDADGFGQNAGGPTPGLRFGGGSSGEGIASNRVIGRHQVRPRFLHELHPAYVDPAERARSRIGTTNPGINWPCGRPRMDPTLFPLTPGTRRADRARTEAPRLRSGMAIFIRGRPRRQRRYQRTVDRRHSAGWWRFFRRQLPTFGDGIVAIRAANAGRLFQGNVPSSLIVMRASLPSRSTIRSILPISIFTTPPSNRPT